MTVRALAFVVASTWLSGAFLGYVLGLVVGRREPRPPAPVPLVGRFGSNSNGLK